MRLDVWRIELGNMKAILPNSATCYNYTPQNEHATKKYPTKRLKTGKSSE